MVLRWFGALLGLIVGLPAGGCGVEECPERPTAAEVGTGAVGFEPVGDALEVHAGSQGLHHVFGSVRTTGLDPGTTEDPFADGNPELAFTLEQDGEVVALFPPSFRGLTPMGDARAEFVGALVVFPAYPEVDVPATLSVNVSDACGRSASDEVTAPLVFRSR